MSIYDKIVCDYQRLTKEAADIRSKLAVLPNGNLICARNGNHFKWYLGGRKRARYLPKSERKLAEQLALRKYLQIRLKYCEREASAQKAYLSRHTKDLADDAETLLQHPGYSDLLFSESNSFINRFSSSARIRQWLAVPNISSPKHPENLKFKTRSGHIVRSKSESMICSILEAHNIPFKYECELILDDKTIYPDFTIMHPVTGEIWYWEHLGMMNDETYATKAFSKLKFYNDHGIIIGQNLILTTETDDYPLDEAAIEKLIDMYFG